MPANEHGGIVGEEVMVVRVVTKKMGHLSMIGCGKIIAVILVSVLLFGLSSDAGPQKNKLLREAREAIDKAVQPSLYYGNS